jgi:hypothetical protein
MENHTTNRWAWLLILTGILITVLTISSCGNESPTMCPLEGVGALEGYLMSSGQGVSAEIWARSMEGPSERMVLHSTVSDSTGWYRLELATGLYRLEVDGGLFSVSSRETRDVIRVLPRVFRFDLERGRAEVRIGMPAEFEGQRMTLWVNGKDHQNGRQREAIQDGWVHFNFPALQPGSYTMEISIPSSNLRYYLPGTMDIFEADSLIVDTNRVTIHETDFRDTYASVSGSITGSWQEGRSGSMRVEAYSVDLKGVGATNCLTDGSFTFGIILPQEIRLKATLNGVGQWMGVESIGDQGVFDLQPGDRITGVDMVESGIQVLLDGPGDLTVHKPSVTILDEEGNEYLPSVYRDNPFYVGNLRPGRYYLQVVGHCENEIWAPQWYGGAEIVADATPIDLAEGELRRIVMELVEGSRIEGELLEPDSQRPDRVSCGLFGLDGEPICSQYYPWRYFDEGLFSFTGLPNGEFLLAARTDRYNYWWYPGTEKFDEAVPIVIENHTSVTDLSWLLPPLWKAADQ